MKKVLITISILVVLVAGWLIISGTGGHQNMPADKTITEKTPDFNLQDYNGKTVSLADFAGKPVVINSWAAWCPFCGKELEDFAFAQKEFGDKIAIIAVNRAESLSKAKNFTDNLKTSNYLIFLLDFSDSFYQSIGGFSMPETIFVDKNGFIQEHKRGPMNFDEIRAKINNLLSI